MSEIFSVISANVQKFLAKKSPDLGDIVCTESGVQEAVTTRITDRWKRFKDVKGILCKESLWVKLRGLVYKMYIQSAMTYKAECWPIKVNDIRIIKSIQMRML